MVKKKQAKPPTVLTGWKQIAQYLGQPMATAQHWAKEGMPVRRQGRSMTASAAELSEWLGREQHHQQPIHIAARGERDLSEELRRGLAEARRRRHRAA